MERIDVMKWPQKESVTIFPDTTLGWEITHYSIPDGYLGSGTIEEIETSSCLCISDNSDRTFPYIIFYKKDYPTNHNIITRLTNGVFLFEIFQRPHLLDSRSLREWISRTLPNPFLIFDSSTTTLFFPFYRVGRDATAKNNYLGYLHLGEIWAGIISGRLVHYNYDKQEPNFQLLGDGDNGVIIEIKETLENYFLSLLVVSIQIDQRVSHLIFSANLPKSQLSTSELISLPPSKKIDTLAAINPHLRFPTPQEKEQIESLILK